MQVVTVVGLAVIIAFLISFLRRLRNFTPLIPRMIGMGLWLFAGWDSNTLLYVDGNMHGLIPVGFYVAAGAYLILNKNEVRERE